ncbi:hypothetical protein [Clostridium tyrobutyricum]|uniref:hypothetical protein n=1 Tax=Clostridium tyrobutyricum TaxID=1519 RepID=UPI0002E5A698|nr:hypothetical protein [Clostridium tyrobutyricum]MEA5009951.1 hypothetical protein [Clostridium tyrobutyricum]
MDVTNKDLKIKKIIIDLSESEIKNIAIWINKLNDIYSDGYRHKYSQILQTLICMEPESRDYLIVNLDILEQNVSKNGNEELISKFEKLYDHVSLEIIRLAQYRIYEKKESNLDAKVDTIQSQYKNINSEYNEMKPELDKMGKSINSAQVSYVSILGIFSSITFALFGGLNILSQVFSKITNLRDHNAFLGIMVIGGFVVFTVFNLLNMLLYSIGRIVDKDLVSRGCNKICKKDKCDCKWYKKAFVKYTHITILNITAIIFITIFLVAYLLE